MLAIIPLQTIHAIVVHFPIVFLISLAALDVVALLRKVRIDGRGGLANLSAGLAVLAGVSALLAYLFGSISQDVAMSSGVAEKVLETHEGFGNITTIALVIWAIVRGYVWWRQVPVEGGRAWGVAVIELALALLIVVTAFYGGQLVYDFGVNVAR